MPGSGDGLKDAISTIVNQSLGNINDSIVKRTATESLARAALQTPQQTPTSVYENGGYQEPYTTAPSIPTDPALTSQTSNYTSLAGPVPHIYAMQSPMAVSQAPNNTYDQQPQYTTREDNSMTPTHAAALAAASSSRPARPQSQSQNANSRYGYQPTQSSNQHTNQPQTTYANTLTPTNTLTPQDWRQWSSMQIQQQPQLSQGEGYHSLHTVNTATSLMSLAERESAGQANAQSQNAQHMDGGAHWPEIQFPGVQTQNGGFGGQ